MFLCSKAKRDRESWLKRRILGFLIRSPEQSNRYYNIDFLRIVFCFCVLLCHSSYLLDFGTLVKNYAGCGRVAVNAFFILSGFLMYNSIRKGKFANLKDFIVAKVARLWPVFAFSELLFLTFYGFGIINQKFHFEHEFLSLLFIRDVGFNSLLDIHPKTHLNGGWETNTHTWYLGPLFWGMLFYFIVLKILENKTKRIDVKASLMVFCCLIFAMLFVNVSIFRCLGRGLCFLALGILFGIVVENLTEKNRASLNITFLKRCLFSIIELLILHRFYLVLFNHNNSHLLRDYYFAYGILFCTLMYSFIFNLGFISLLLNRKIFSVIGSWGYSVYVMQWIIQETLSPFNNNKLYAKCEFYRAFKNEHPIAMFWIYILICFIVGALAYYFVEKLCYI